MVEIIDNQWRALIKLRGVPFEDKPIDVYLDLAKRPTFMEGDGKTIITLPNEAGHLEVLDSVADIIKAANDIIENNKKKEAEANEAAVMAHIKQFEEGANK